MKETISSLAKLNYLSSSSDNKNCDDKISLAIDIAKEISNTDVASYQSFLNVQDENRFQKLLSRFKIAQKEYKKIPKETRDLFNDAMLGKNYMNFYDTPLDIAYFYNNTPLGINYESKKISWKLHDDVIAYQAFLDAKNELKSYAKLQDYIDTANLTASSKRTNLALSESKKYL